MEEMLISDYRLDYIILQYKLDYKSSKETNWALVNDMSKSKPQLIL
jgi:hypothetical protein